MYQLINKNKNTILESLFLYKKNNDITFNVNDVLVKSHVNVLISGCTYFEKLLDKRYCDYKKEIKIECSDTIFTEILRYIYLTEFKFYSFEDLMAAIVYADSICFSEMRDEMLRLIDPISIPPSENIEKMIAILANNAFDKNIIRDKIQLLITGKDGIKKMIALQNILDGLEAEVYESGDIFTKKTCLLDPTKSSTYPHTSNYFFSDLIRHEKSLIELIGGQTLYYIPERRTLDKSNKSYFNMRFLTQYKIDKYPFFKKYDFSKIFKPIKEFINHPNLKNILVIDTSDDKYHVADRRRWYTERCMISNLGGSESDCLVCFKKEMMPYTKTSYEQYTLMFDIVKNIKKHNMSNYKIFYK